MLILPRGWCSIVLSQFQEFHYVLRVLKTSLWNPRCQTYVFKTKIAQGIQKWFQNNQFQTLPSNDFFKKLFSEQKNHQ